MIGIFGFLSSIFLSIAVVWYLITPGIIVLSLILSLTLAICLRRWRKGVQNTPTQEPEWLLPKRLYCQGCFYFVSDFNFLLFQSMKCSFTTNSWQTIHPFYLPIFLCSLILAMFLFLRLSNKNCTRRYYHLFFHSTSLSAPVSCFLGAGTCGDTWLWRIN